LHSVVKLYSISQFTVTDHYSGAPYGTESYPLLSSSTNTANGIVVFPKPSRKVNEAECPTNRRRCNLQDAKSSDDQWPSLANMQMSTNGMARSKHFAFCLMNIYNVHYYKLTAWRSH